MRMMRDDLPENVAFQNVEQKHRLRKIREQRSGKEHLKDNLKAMKGMRILKEKCRKKDFEWRGRKNLTKEEDYENLMLKGDEEKAILTEKYPDIVERLNTKIRGDKERNRQKKEKEAQHIEMIEREEKLRQELREQLNWEEDFTIKLTEEEELSLKLQEQKHYEDWAESRRQEAKNKRKEKQESLKAAMTVPLPAFPEEELCPYEQLRANNIREIEEAMKESDFFEDLSQRRSGES